MKAIEFMGGDWALINGTPRKVQAVDCVDNEIMADDELYTLAEDRYHSEDKVEGVPITPEILAKNGFKIVFGFGYSESYPTYGWGYLRGMRDYATVDVRFYSEPIGGVSRLVKMETASEKDDGINSIHSCDIEFIHELQHAMRLCGIEKEIEL